MDDLEIVMILALISDQLEEVQTYVDATGAGAPQVKASTSLKIAREAVRSVEKALTPGP